MHHYVYSITYTNLPNIYYGSRSCKCSPEEDTKYWGSPVTFKEFMDNHKTTRVKTIIAVGFETREDAIIYENDLIQKQWETDKPLSLNASIRGEKFNMQGVKRSKETRKKMSDAQKGNTHCKGYKHSYEFRQKMSEIMKGNSNSKGFVHSAETRRKLGEARKGEKHYLWGKHLPLETRQKMSEARKGRSVTKETRKKLSEAHKGHNHTPTKSFIGISPNGDIVPFNNASKFCKDNPDWKFCSSHITECAQGKRKTHKKWKFYYADESNIA